MTIINSNSIVNLRQNFITSNYEGIKPQDRTTNFMGEIKLSPEMRTRFSELLTPVKEESVKNPDGTTSTIQTFANGNTVTVTNKKDASGLEYNETVWKNSEGTTTSEIIVYPGKSESVKSYDNSGILESTHSRIYAADGTTVKTEDSVVYNGTDANGNPKISLEQHTYENGSMSEIHYDEKGKPDYGTVQTKDGKNAVELTFDLKDSNLETGNVKIDDKGWPVTTDGKFPKILKRVTNPGLPTSTTHEYKYNDDGSVTEFYYPTGGGTKRTYTYKSIEDLKNNRSTIEDMIGQGGKFIPKNSPENPEQQAESPNPQPLPTGIATPPKIDEPKSTEQSQHTVHKIQRGESLSEIAKKYGTTVEELMRLNNIKNPNLITAGKTLKIPVNGQNTVEVSASKNPRSNATGARQNKSLAPKYSEVLSAFERMWNDASAHSKSEHKFSGIDAKEYKSMTTYLSNILENPDIDSETKIYVQQKLQALRLMKEVTEKKNLANSLYDKDAENLITYELMLLYNSKGIKGILEKYGKKTSTYGYTI